MPLVFPLPPSLLHANKKAIVQAEELLRSAGDGDAASLSKIHTVLGELNARSEASRLVCRPPPPPPRKPPPRMAPYTGAPKVLDIRPLPFEQLSANRHVPTLTQTNGIPFFRFKKPQSEFLSRVLRDKLSLKERRFATLERLEQNIQHGTEEAKWESIVMKQLHEEGGPDRRWLVGEGRDWSKDRNGWISEAKMAKADIWRKLQEDLEKNKEVGERMIQIHEEEKRLWSEERTARRHARMVAKKARKLAEGEAQGGGKHQSP